MKVFVDTSDLEAIEAALERRVVTGVTVAPWASAENPVTDLRAHVGKIAELCRRHGGPSFPISVELLGGDFDTAEREATEFAEACAYEGLSVKVPIGWETLPIISRLARAGIQVNCTCCVALGQAVITVGRNSDLYDAASVMSDISQMLGRESQTELMVAGITHLNGIAEAIRAGVDIVAVPPAFLQPMASNRRTDELVKELAEQFEAWRRSVDAGPAADDQPPDDSGTASGSSHG